jgi:hypothetical protein
MDKLQQKRPSLVYTDICCQDREFLEGVWPTLEQQLGEIKPFKVEDSIIHYCSDVDAINVSHNLKPLTYETKIAAIRALMIKNMGYNKMASIDTEWTIDYGGGPQGKISVVTIGFDRSLFENGMYLSNGLYYQGQSSSSN